MVKVGVGVKVKRVMVWRYYIGDNSTGENCR